MSARMQWIALVAVAVWGLGLVPAAARAGTLYDNAGFIKGQQSFVQSFDITTPGTLTVTLSDVPWLDTLSDLNCFLSSSSGVIGKTWGAGTESIEVSPGMIYAHWFGVADGSFGVGVYSHKVSFQPAGAPVPLPPSVILLLSALVFLWTFGLRRSPGGRDGSAEEERSGEPDARALRSGQTRPGASPIL